MRTRAADVGGVLSVESRVGGGTAISVRIDTEVASATDDAVTSLVEQIRARAR